MKALLRNAVVATAAVALVGLGFPGGTRVAFADTSPSFTSITMASPINEGDTAVVSGTFSAPDPNADPLISINWGNGMAVEFLSPGAGGTTFEFQTLFKDEGKGSFNVTLTLDDGVNLPVTQTLTLVVLNVAPTVNMTASATTLLDHDTLTVDASFTDPGVLDTFNARINWGDGSPAATQTYTATAPKTFNASHVYPMPGSYTVTTTVTDNDGGVGTATAPLTVNARNTPPSNVVLSGASVVAGTPATLQGTFVDPDATDTHTVSLDWGDISTPSSLSLAAGAVSFSATHTYANAGTFTVSATVTDSANASASGTLSYVVLKPNSPPANLVVSTPEAVLGSATTLSGTFSDADAADTHSVTVDWGDTSTQTLSLDAAVFSFSATHTYASAGSYTVTVTVSDSKASTSATSTANVRTETVDELLTDLTTLIQSWNLDDGSENSLLTKVKPTCNSLSALSNLVSAQTNKKLTMDQVNAFNAVVTQLSGQLSCSGAVLASPKAKIATAH
jgi:PKD repeat protein